MKRNNTAPPDITAVHIDDQRLAFDLEDARTVSVPLAFYPTLMLASAEERNDYEVCHSSVHWPKLDCDINSEALLRGAKETRKYAERAWRRKQQAEAVRR
jgi:uncharacterized protein DUF2442